MQGPTDEARDQQLPPPGVGASETAEEINERILAAAQQEFELIGIRRSSVLDVARRAGLGRATVYRRYPGKDSLVQAVAEREMLAVLARVASTVALADTSASAVVQLSVASARELRSNRLLARLMATEPEEIFMYASVNGSVALATARSFVIKFLKMLHDDRGPSEDELAIASEMMIRLALSQLLIPGGVIPFDDDESVAAFAAQYLAPLVSASSASSASKG